MRDMLRSVVIGALLTVLGCGSAYAAQATRGYTHGACDLDLNGNGVMGEAADCTICDGDANADVDEIYVDCDSGSDSNSGTAGSPYLTVGKALSVADGPSVGQEDAICIHGTCASESFPLSLNISGKVATFTRTADADANEVRDFEYPDEPFGIYCWDFATDDDDYSNETCTISSASGNEEFCFTINADYFEMAHMTVTGCGEANGTCACTAPATSCSGADASECGSQSCNNGFCDDSGLVNASAAQQTHHWWHHNTFSNINKDSAHVGGVRVFGYFQSDGGAVDWLAIENNYVPDFAGYFLRGGQGGGALGEAENWRIMNNTTTCHGCDQNAGTCSGAADNTVKCTMADVWGALSNVEILNNDSDANVANWDQGTAAGWLPHACTQNWDVINNRMIDFQHPFRADPDDFGNVCDALVRPMTNMNWISNEVVVRSKADWGGTQLFAFLLQGGDMGGSQWETIKDALIMNNTITCETASDTLGAVFTLAVGHDSDTCPGGHAGGTIKVINNTSNCNGSHNARGAIFVSSANGASAANDRRCNHENYVIRNNIIDGFTAGNGATCVQVNSDWSGTSLDIDYNAYDADCTFHWLGTEKASLAAWSGTTGIGDDSSQSCSPTFTSATDLHLQGGDTCAQSLGETRTEDLSRDRDRDTRSAPWDIGSDEISAGANCTTNGDCNDANECTTDTCAAGNCSNVNVSNGTSCTDDTLFCTGTETCQGGVCTGSGDPCTGADGDSDCSETCDEALNNCLADDPNGSACDDGLFCTSTDTCDGAGTCSGTGDPCNTGETCNEGTNACDGVASCSWSTSCTWTVDPLTDSSNATRNYRSVVPASYCTASGSKVRVTVQAETTPSGTPTINGMSIGQQDQTTLQNYIATPSWASITWGGNPHGTAQTFTAGESLVSDEIDFDFDHTVAHLIHMYMTGREFMEMTDGATRYFNSTATDGSLDINGPTGVAANMWGVTKLEVCTDTGACTTNTDCSDSNACTNDTCTAGVCANTHDSSISGCLRGSLLRCLTNCVVR